MAAEYVYSVASIKYGTPTGTNTMPASGAMVTLPNTSKGTVTLEETEGASVQFFVDQLKNPIKTVKTEEGSLVVTAQFFDLNVQALATFKGGTATTGVINKFVASTGYTLVEKAIQVNFDSGHVLNLFNASCVARITGGGGRDKMIAWELKASPQASADNTGSYEYYK